MSSHSAIEFAASRESHLISRNIVVSGRRTSVRLEGDIWNGLTEIARLENTTINQLCGLVDRKRKQDTSLTAAIRVFIMAYFRFISEHIQSNKPKIDHLGNIQPTNTLAVGEQPTPVGSYAILDSIPAK